MPPGRRLLSRRRSVLAIVAVGIAVIAVASHRPDTIGGRPLAQRSQADGLALTGRVGGTVGAIATDGHLVLASIGLHLHTFDVSDPNAPQLVAVAPMEGGRATPLPGNLVHMARQGNRLYGLVDWDRQPPVDEDTTLQLVVLERSAERAAWTLRHTLDLPLYTLAHQPQPPMPGLVVERDRAYVLGYDEDGDPALIVVVAAESKAPRIAGRYELAYLQSALAATGDYVYVARWSDDPTTVVQIVDVTDPAAPTTAGELETVSSIMDIVIAEGKAFVIGCEELQVLDISDPATPEPIGPAMTFSADATGRDTGHCLYWAEADWHEGDLYALTVADYGLTSGSTYLWRFDVRDPAQPAVASRLEVPLAEATWLTIGGGYAAIGGAFDGHLLIDLANPNEPREAARLSDEQRLGEAVAAEGSLAVRSMAYGFEGAIEFLDLAEEQLPNLRGAVALTGALSATDIVLTGTTAFAAIAERGVLVIEAADPDAPQLIATVPPLAEPRALAVEGSTAYIAEAGKVGEARGALRLFDVRDPARPTELSRLAGDFAAVAASGDYVYVGGRHESRLEVVDVRSQAAPLVVGGLPLDGTVRQLAIDGDRLLVLTPDTLHVLDIATRTAPRHLGRIDVALEAPWLCNVEEARGLAARGDVAYVASHRVLQVIEMRDPTEPRRVSIRQVPDVFLGMGNSFTPAHTGGDLALAGHTLLFAGDGSGTWTFGAGTPSGLTEEFEGIYWANFEHSEFAPDYAGCPSSDRWWYLFATDEFRERYDLLRPDCLSFPPGDGSCFVWTRFEGHVTPPINPGIPWQHSRSVTVTRLISMRPIPDCSPPEPYSTRLFLPQANCCLSERGALHLTPPAAMRTPRFPH